MLAPLPAIDSEEAFYAEIGRAAPLPQGNINCRSAAAAVSVLIGEGPKPAASN